MARSTTAHLFSSANGVREWPGPLTRLRLDDALVTPAGNAVLTDPLREE